MVKPSATPLRRSRSRQPTGISHDQRSRLEDREDRHYPVYAGLAEHIISGLMERDFDITAVKAWWGSNSRGMPTRSSTGATWGAPIPIVPVFLNTYYPPNQPSPRRCQNLGIAIRDLVARFPRDIRVGILASGGLSHFLVNEKLDRKRGHRDQGERLRGTEVLAQRSCCTPARQNPNWITVAAAAKDLGLDWIDYVPAYRSRAMTGVGLCFAALESRSVSERAKCLSPNIRGVNINWQVVGDAGPWVIMTTGGRRGHDEFVSLARKVAAHGYRVMLHDRRNTGASDIRIEGDESEEQIWTGDMYELMRNRAPCPLSSAAHRPAHAHPSSSRCVIRRRCADCCSYVLPAGPLLQAACRKTITGSSSVPPRKAA